MSRSIVVALVCLGLIVSQSSPASASNRKSRVIAAARKADRSAEEFIRKFNKLSVSEQQKVKASIQKLNLPDADADGVPDLVENSEGTDSCDGDSDDDGNSDGSEREAEGKISAVSESSITVGGLVFVINENTVLEGIAREALLVDVCVEAEGALVADAIIASKIESSDDCSGSHHGSGHRWNRR